MLQHAAACLASRGQERAEVVSQQPRIHSTRRIACNARGLAHATPLAAAQARSRKAEQEEAIAAKEAKKNMDPRELFRSQTDLYSKFDADGLPTHDTQGAELSKSKVKALKKDWDKQKKLYDAAHK